MSYCVPNLQLNDLIVNLKSEMTELHSDGDLVLHFKFIVHNSFHEARFTDTSISDNDKLEKMVLCVEGLVGNDLVRDLLYLLDFIVFHFKLILINIS